MLDSGFLPGSHWSWRKSELDKMLLVSELCTLQEASQVFLKHDSDCVISPLTPSVALHYQQDGVLTASLYTLVIHNLTLPILSLELLEILELFHALL
jgi:hypothetical protein